jgi:phosphinothricin acetyltransferase
MRPGDWEAVRAIYLDGMASGAATFETGAPEWAEWDRTHLKIGRLVALAPDSNEVIGWAALAPAAEAQALSGVASVSVCVAEAWRGKGVGTALMAALIAASEQSGIWTLEARVFADIEAAIALFANVGFREVGRRERFGKSGGVWRDLVILERRSEVIGAQ